MRVKPPAIVVAVLAVAALGWLVADVRMAGMDEGLWTDPVSLGFYVPVWVAMTAAMMLPSAAPMVVAHSAVERRKRDLGRAPSRGGSAAFAGGYLLAWTAFGVVAYALFELLRSLDVDALSWGRDGRYLAAALTALAAVYQLTRSRASASRSAAARWRSSSGPGATGGAAPFEWAPSRAPGASAVAGR